MPGYDMEMGDGMGMRKRPMMGGPGQMGGGVDFSMGDSIGGGMDYPSGGMGQPAADDFSGMGDPLGGATDMQMHQGDSMMFGGMDAFSMAGYQETPSFDSAYQDMDDDGLDYGPDPMEGVHIDMGEQMFDEGSAAEGNTLGDLLSDSAVAPDVSGITMDYDSVVDPQPTMGGGDMGMVTDAVSDYKSMGGMGGSMDAGMSKSMEYRGMGQRLMAPMRGGRGKMMY